jgi:meiotically up-regulated gene 157 (Mug157) protein
MMDDANVPSLLSLPWLGAVRADDARWRETRRRVLSGAGNTFYVQGRVAAGVGSPHTGARAVWPLALVMQALTAEDDAERTDMLRALLAGSARTGFLHEAFDADDPTRFTRPWFAWANSMFGELVLSLHETRPHVLKEFEA